MITAPIKALAVARGKPAQPERTVANELPQELSKLSEQYGFSDVHSFLKGSATQGGSREKAGRPKQAAVVPKTGKRVVITTTGFTDEGHPTILADTHGLVHPGGKITHR